MLIVSHQKASSWQTSATSSMQRGLQSSTTWTYTSSLRRTPSSLKKRFRKHPENHKTSAKRKRSTWTPRQPQDNQRRLRNTLESIWTASETPRKGVQRLFKEGLRLRHARTLDLEIARDNNVLLFDENSWIKIMWKTRRLQHVSSDLRILYRSVTWFL